MQILGIANSYASAPVNAPTSLSAVPSTTSVAISFTAPTNDGGATITNYEYNIDGGSFIALSPADATSPITISGLSQAVSYTVTLRAVNIVGAGPASAGVSFTTIAPLSLEYLAVGGGGGRSPGVYGAYWGAGGAGGAMRDATVLAVNGTYTCTVGGWGGNCGNGGSSTIVHSVDGTIASARYGGAAGGPTGGSNGDFSGGTQGGLDGGGGAGANGNGGQGGYSGVGGAGKASSITGSSLTYGGGGGGNVGNGNPAANGSCTSGFGRGGRANNALDSNCGSASDAGSAGVVIIRYLTDVKTANSKTVTGGSISTVGSYTVHTFTSTANLVVS
jgi:mucin-19